MEKSVFNFYTAVLSFCFRKTAAWLKLIFAGLMLIVLFLSGITQAQENENMSGTKIKLSFNGQEAIIRMTDNSAAQQFLAMLPAKFDFSDFYGKEKIADFPKPIDLSKAPRGMIGSKGKLFIYAPWGNMGIFYKDFSCRPDNNLIELGTVENGLNELSIQNNNFSAEIEIIK